MCSVVGRFSVCNYLVLLLLLCSLALPVCAQGQTPTSPRPRPNQQRLQQQQQRQDPLQQPMGTEGGQRESLRERRERTTEERRNANDRDGRERNQEGEGQQGGEESGPEVINQGVLEPGGAQEETAGTSVISGAAPEGQVAPGTPGTAPMPRAGTTPGTAGGVGITVIGEAPFEPAYDREIEWPEVPDVGEPLQNLEGPIQLSEFLQTISLATNWNIIMSSGVEQTGLGYFIFVEVRPAEALKLLRAYDLYYEFDEETNTLTVKGLREVQEEAFGKLVEHKFVVQHADVPYVESVLATVVSPAGRVIVDQRTGHIYVWDTQDNIDHMVTMVDDLDVPLEKREFVIQYAELPDIQVVLESMLTPSGRLVADPRTGQLFAWDRPFALEQMASAVSQLDVPVETLTVPMRFVNAEDVTDNLEALMSERGLIQVDPRTNALVITDIPARVDRMAKLIETFDAELTTQTWTLNYADPEFVADQLEIYIPDEMGEIVLNEDRHQLTVTGLPARLEQIDALVKTWDIPRQQVHIEAFIVEVGSEVEREFNVNWSYFGTSGNVPIVLHSGDGVDGLAEPTGDGESLSVGQLPYAIPLYGALELDANNNIRRPVLTNVAGETMIERFGGNNLAVALNYLDQQNKATILASPRITVNDGEEAIFENATRVPYVSSTTIFGGFTGNNNFNQGINNTNRVDFIDVGTILSVLPRINEEGGIILEIDAEDSTFVLRNILANGQTSTIPEKTLRRAQTELRVNSGETVVLGGLRRDRAAESVSKTPLLGDLPVVGRLFRNPSRASQNNTLLIFITTTIVEPTTNPESQILLNAEQEIASSMRHNKKSLWGRIADKVTGGSNELIIAIGQNGDLHAEGQLLTLETLKEEFAQAPAGVRIVLRRHPGAPQPTVDEIVAAIEANKLPLVYDDDLVPLVPSYDLGDTLEPLEPLNQAPPLPTTPVEAQAVEPGV